MIELFSSLSFLFHLALFLFRVNMLTMFTLFFFTTWGLILTIISLALVASNSKKYKRVFQLALISQFIVTTVYWVALHQSILEVHATGEFGPHFLSVMIVSHLTPYLSLCIIMYFKQIKLDVNDCNYYTWLSILYLAVNYAGS